MRHATHKATVLTGDLVKSSALTKAQMDHAFRTLQDTAQDMAVWHEASLQFSRHRGDGWQVILNKPQYALRTALIFTAKLKSLGPEFNTYIGIATGELQHANTSDLNDRNDTVFIQSGRALETLKSMTSFAPKLAFSEPGAEAATTVLADFIAEDWTPAQAETMAQMLAPNANLSFTDLAKILNKSRQVVTRTLNAAGYQSLYLALRLLEKQND